MSIKYDYLLKFENTPIGKTSIQHFVVKNGIKYPNWIVEEKDGAHVLCNAFSVKKKLTKNNKNDIHEIIIKYTPTESNQTYINYYAIKYSTDNEEILCVRAKSEDVSIQSSMKYINFYRLLNDTKVKTTFKLVNNSQSVLKYIFDIDNNQKIFQVTPEYGEILPGRDEYIKVSFVTQKPGIFFFDLPCLILFHGPIFIELLGINAPTKTDTELKTRKGQCWRLSLEKGFKKYLNEQRRSISDMSCTISKIYLDVTISNPINYVDIFNHTVECMRIKWDTDCEEVFLLKPDTNVIHPSDRATFKIKFKTELKQLFGAKLYGRAIIYRDINQDELDCEIIPISLRITGNSFSKTNTWVPNVELNQKIVTLPVCIPEESVFTTFCMTKIGEFPVVYKFIPPDRSRFEVKPMLGIIRNEFQIFALGFTGKNLTNSNFQEKWRIELNQNPNEYVDIIFIASVQELNVEVGSKNKINFGTVFPGCNRLLTIPLVNHSQNSTRFKFTSNKWFSVNPSEGELHCHEVLNLVWTYNSDCDVPEVTKLYFEVQALCDKNAITGLPIVNVVDIYAKSAYSKLCSIPSICDFNSIACNVSYSTSFTIFNFGDCDVAFNLKVMEHFGMSEEIPCPVTINPKRGSLLSGQSMTVAVNIKTNWSCLSTYCIRYFLCVNETSEEEIPSPAPCVVTNSSLFRIDYYSYYPTLKFIEICKNTTGPLFGKLSIWEYFNMDCFNEVLRTIRINETRSFRIRVPDAETGLSIQKSTTFILKNISRVDTTCSFVRKKICECKMKQATSNKGVQSFRKYSYDDCKHRKIINISISDEEIKAFSMANVTIETNYLLTGDQEVCYQMKLSHNRTIELYFQVIGLRPAQLSTYHCGFQLNMHSVYMGELIPDLHIYWFVNNTRDSANYSLDITPLQEYNRNVGYAVFKCLNPEGEVEPKSIHRILFHFTPLTSGKIFLELPFNFSDKKSKLALYGEGTPFYTSSLEQLYFTELGKDYHRGTGLLVSISTESIMIKGIPTFCSTTRIFTLRNISPGRCIAFTFDDLHIKNILSATVTPKCGILQQDDLIVFVLRVDTWGNPCALRETITCHLIDKTTLEEHVNSSSAYHQQTIDLHDLIHIGDGGVTIYPEPVEKHITPAPKVFHRNLTLSIHIVSIADIDVKLSMQDQLNQMPFYEIPFSDPISVVENLLIQRQSLIESNESLKCTQVCCTYVTDEQFVIVHSVLNCLIKQTLFSKKFKYDLNLMSQYPNYYYTDFDVNALTIQEEIDMTELIVRQIPRWFLSDVILEILGDCVVQYFQLGIYPNSQRIYHKSLIGLTPHNTYGTTTYTEKFLFLLNSL